MSDGTGQTPPPFDPSAAPPPQQFPPPGGAPVPPPQGAPAPGQGAPAYGAPPPGTAAPGAPAPGAPTPGAPTPGAPFDPTYGYGAPPPVVEPPKKSKKWIWIVLAAILLPVLGIGGCVAAILVAGKGPVDASNNYLVLLDEQRYGEAYDALIPGCMPVDRDTFIELMTPIDITGYNVNAFFTSGDEATADGTITLGPDGATTPIHFELRNVDDSWQVCSFDFELPGN